MIAPGIETGSDIHTLRRQICERANEAVRISYQTVFFRSGETPAPHDCHANVDRWCSENPGHFPVRGWLVTGFIFDKHSVVRGPQCELFDITPL